MKELFLDIETSGTDPKRHSILSLGMVVSINGIEDYQSFYREIRYEELLVVPDAIEVNRFSFVDQTGRVSLAQADEEAHLFIKKHFSETSPMPIGLNVGSFDMQFIHHHMPKLAKHFGYRSVDLNSIMYFLAEKHSTSFKGLKIKMSDRAHAMVQDMALGVEKHNALYDSVFNLCLYSILKQSLCE